MKFDGDAFGKPAAENRESPGERRSSTEALCVGWCLIGRLAGSGVWVVETQQRGYGRRLVC